MTSDVPADTEVRGINRAQLGALFAILGLTVGLIGPFALVVVLGLTLPFLGSVFGTAVFTIQTLETILGLFVGGALVELVSFGIYASAFGILRKVDPRFRIPRALALVGLAGFFMVVMGAGIVLAEIVQAFACAWGVGATGCLGPRVLFATSGLALLDSLPALVGWIGPVIGPFRAGNRYRSRMLKIGAILTFIPFVNRVAPILFFLAVRQTPRKFDLSARTEDPAEATTRR